MDKQIENIAKYAMLKAGIDPYAVMPLPDTESFSDIEHVEDTLDVVTGINKRIMFMKDTLEHDRKTRLEHLPPHIGVEYFVDRTIYTDGGSIRAIVSYRPVYILI